MMSEIDKLLDIMKTLRSEDGCPWDQKQTLETLRPYAVEEVYEVLDAIDRGHVDDHCEELGDLLLQVVFHSQIRAEEGKFDFNDVARTINEKLIRRHPHVFGELEVSGADEVLVNWNAIKQEEKADRQTPDRILDAIPVHLPACLKAQEIQKSVAKVGFDWTALDPVVDKIREELAEVEAEIESDQIEAAREEVGDLLFAVVNLARHLGGNAEQLLQDTNRKFTVRFNGVEEEVNRSDRSWEAWSLSELEAVWTQVKNAAKQLS